MKNPFKKSDPIQADRLHRDGSGAEPRATAGNGSGGDRVLKRKWVAIPLVIFIVLGGPGVGTGVPLLFAPG